MGDIMGCIYPIRKLFNKYRHDKQYTQCDHKPTTYSPPLKQYSTPNTSRLPYRKHTDSPELFITDDKINYKIESRSVDIGEQEDTIETQPLNISPSGLSGLDLAQLLSLNNTFVETEGEVTFNWEEKHMIEELQTELENELPNELQND
eukprot:312465_1